MSSSPAKTDDKTDPDQPGANHTGSDQPATDSLADPTQTTDETGTPDGSPDAAETSPETTDAPALPADIAAMGYEEARDELADIVRKLETGNHTLEESLTLWQRGEHLAHHCSAWLDNATATVQKALDANKS